MLRARRTNLADVVCQVNGLPVLLALIGEDKEALRQIWRRVTGYQRRHPRLMTCVQIIVVWAGRRI